MSVSRRAVLAGGASLLAAGSVSALAPQANAASAPTRPKGLGLRRSAFLPLVGQRFQILHDQGARTVVLRRVSDLTASARPGAEDQFSLVFVDAGARPAIRQGTYSIDHARQGRISLFIAPVGGRQSAQRYEAVIDSRPLSAVA